MTTKKLRSFTRAFKAEAVKLVIEHRMTMAKVSRDGLTPPGRVGYV